jgi:hypothetical protein
MEGGARLRSLDAGSACAGKATWSSRVTLALARVLLGFAWRRMPELTGHSLEDVERHLRKGAFRPRDFATR